MDTRANGHLALADLRRPVVAAPMAGGPSTPDLVRAVGDAGGLGFLAAGYVSADRLAADIARTRTLTTHPFGVNVFVPTTSPVDESAVAAYARRLEPEARRRGVSLGRPDGGDWDDDGDDWDAKVALLLEDPVAVVSFAFGCPSPVTVAELQARGSSVLVTVTTVDDARRAVAAGADGLVVQGLEAGAHRGGSGDSGDDEMGLLPLLRSVAREAPATPLLGAGGVVDGAGVAAVLGAGAAAVALGTAFLLCPEAGTAPVHRTALTGNRPTALTRAFTGRRARGLVNRFLTEHSAAAPAAYPHVHHLTAPLRAAARAEGDPEALHLWAGEGYRGVREMPAEQLVTKITEEAAAAADHASARLHLQ